MKSVPFLPSPPFPSLFLLSPKKEKRKERTKEKRKERYTPIILLLFYPILSIYPSVPEIGTLAVYADSESNEEENTHETDSI